MPPPASRTLVTMTSLPTQAAAVLIGLASAGCVPLYAGAAGVVTVGPTVMPVMGTKGGNGDGLLEVGGTMLAEGARADGTKLPGGGGLRLHSIARLGNSRLSAMTFGRTELGSFDHDGYGSTGAELGPGLRLGERVTVGAGLGYEFGGYPQNAHNVPARVGMLVHAGGFVLHGSAYAAWRFGDGGAYPAATSSFGPGWNSWGLDASIGFAVPKGLSAGFTVDHQDDIAIGALTISGVLTPDE